MVDNILRCDSCQELVKLKSIHKLGVCKHCGNKRFKSVLILSTEERNKLDSWGEHEFLKEFQAVEENDDE
jgi:DNA-directed RNA polymerase subunit RPC12/RpoP